MNCLRVLGLLVGLAASGTAAASEYHGQVTFGGLPIPGATVTAMQGSTRLIAVTNEQGRYSFPDLSDGAWTIVVAMTGFSTIQREVVIGRNVPAAVWNLKLLPLAQMKAQIAAPQAAADASAKNSPRAQSGGPGLPNPPGPVTPSESQPPATAPGTSQEELNELASPGLLINGSVNNGAASPFAQFPAFGNFRRGRGGLYNGGIGFILDNSAVDARPFSLSGQPTPQPTYNRVMGVATFAGPLRIPHLIRNGPNVFVGYQWTRYLTTATESALVPSVAERGGDLQNAQGVIFDPVTGLPFPGNVIPQRRISPQAQALLHFYPLPNFSGNARYNYQVPISSSTHQDALQSRFDKVFNAQNQFHGGFAFQSTRTAAPNLFGFLDSSRLLGTNANLRWSHQLAQHLFLNLGFQFSRLAVHNTPYFENRTNVSGQAGISGNNQGPMNWGPPTLNFASGIAGLSDGQASFNRNQTAAWSYSVLWNHGLHNLTLGGDYRRQLFNYLAQQNPRGTFTFTGAATAGGSGGVAAGPDFADFLLGIPDASSLAFGNADKYFRESVYDVFANDDYRIGPEFTLNFGLRWEYGAPITELYGRLVNLDIVPGFLAAAPVAAADPLGVLTGQRYPDSLIHPDRSAFQPRLGVAWRPIAGSSLVLRAGYGVYYNTSVYQTIALQMAQQAPLSKSVNLQNGPACPLTLANGFVNCSATTAENFAIDPYFRVGYVQEWKLSIQRDLPGALQMTATYLGSKGARELQEFLPNTFPIGAVNPCPGCPTGFAYFTSHGHSSREGAQVQLRRRLESGFTATVQYTYSKAIDDSSALGGAGAYTPTQNSTLLPWLAQGPGASGGAGQTTPTIAQNWLDLGAERSLSPFDQRHLLNAQLQYTSGMGLAGGTLLSGWRGRAFKEWTVLTQVTLGSGLPETPIYLATVPGTGVTGTIRPDYTGAAVHNAPGGLFLNPAAYTAPPPGHWGNTGRDSILGPSVFSVNASLGRTFRLRGKYNVDFRVDSSNVLNHVTYTTWYTIINSTQFGLPSAANGMRSLQTTLRLRF